MDLRTKTWLGAAAGLICVTFLSTFVFLQSLSVGVGPYGRATELYLKTIHAKQGDVEAAEFGIEAFGLNAMPTITNMLCFRDSTWRSKLRTVVKDQSLVGWKVHSEFEFQEMALMGIKRLGEPAGPFLVELFRGDVMKYEPGNPAYRAMKAMVALGTPAIPALSAGLTNGNSGVRVNCALTIANSFDLRDASQVTNLVGCMKDADENIRAAAAFALGRVLESPKASVPALAKGLADDYSAVRFHSIHSLWAFGVHSRGIMPQIEAAIAREQQLPDAGLDQWELGPKSKEMILYAMTNALETIRYHVETPN